MKSQMQQNENEKQDLLKQISDLREALKNHPKQLSNSASFTEFADIQLQESKTRQQKSRQESNNDELR